MALTMDYKCSLKYFNMRGRYDKDFFSNFPDVKEEISVDTTFPNVYLMISNINGDKNKLFITVDFYKDDSKTVIIETKNYSFSPSVDDNSDNFIKQGYEYLKALPEFLNTLDC